MFTAIFDRFIEPARAKPQLWRFFLGLVVITAVFLLGLALLFGATFLSAGGSRTAQLAAEVSLGGITPASMLLLFASFTGMVLGPMLAVRLLHGRAVGTLFGPAARVLHDFVVAAAVVFALYAVMLGFWSLAYDATPNLDLWQWLKFLPLALVGLLIQTCAEELVFRGYMLQQLAARFRQPLIWMVLPALAFGSLHYDPSVSGSNAWIIMGATAMFGLAAADLTRVSGSLGAAWGFHFANNAVAILLVAVKGSVTGLALYLTPYDAADASQIPLLSMSDLGVMALVWLILRRLLRR